MMTIRSHLCIYTVQNCETLAQALEQAVNGKTFLLIDQEVHRLYKEDFKKLDRPIRTVVANEENKSYQRLEPLFQWLIENEFRKDSTLLVVGGGVLQDIGCFLSSVLYRGVKWELIPTTLLSQSDSCVGSKSSINFGTFKNQLGTFYPPARILLTFDVLKTLPLEEIRSGLGEIVKIALLESETVYIETQKAVGSLLPLRDNFDLQPLRLLVEQSLRLKKQYVEEDEFDKARRNLLNYGHTFGHGFESATAYKIPHGIAVLLGISAASFVSAKLNLISFADFLKLNLFLQKIYSPFEAELLKCDKEKVLSSMAKDKKNEGQKVGLILTRGPGRMEKFLVSMNDQLRPLLIEYFQFLQNTIL